MNSFAEKLLGDKWAALLHSTCEDFLVDVPDDTFDMCLLSPPYENRRYYDELNFRRKGEEWVAWMVGVCHGLARVCKGPVIVNCQGQTDDYRYSAVPMLLAADLARGGLHLRCPVIYYRNGIAGSGGPDYLRNDYEFCLVFSKARGKFPYANPTACGHPPRWAPGGACSSRLPDGKRINAWGSTGHSSGPRRAHGKRQYGARPGHTFSTKAALLAGEGAEPAEADETGLFDEAADPAAKKKKPRKAKKVATSGRKDGDSKNERSYVAPKISNPGNVVKALYTAEDVAAILATYGVGGFGDVLHCLVGGGLMSDAGDGTVHENEAPMSIHLADFLIRTWCPPGGLVYDPFLGSGTTMRAAVLAGRKGIGTDARASQVKLATKRLAHLSPGLFDEEVRNLHRFDTGAEYAKNLVQAFALRLMEAQCQETPGGDHAKD